MYLTRLVGLAFLLLVSGAAQAQRVPTSLALVALSPLVVVVLATVLGVLVRSWRVGTLHVFLVLTWAITFLLVAQHVEGDYKTYLIWIPIIGYVVHTLVILVLLVVHMAKRLSAHDRPA